MKINPLSRNRNPNVAIAALVAFWFVKIMLPPGIEGEITGLAAKFSSAVIRRRLKASIGASKTIERLTT